MKEVSEHDFNVSLLVSIRDDYLSLLGGYFNSAIPSILNNQQRLEMMGRKQAERAITRPLVDLKPSCSYAPDLLPVLLSDLAAGYDTGVALPHLQIVCTELYKLYRRQVANEGSITLQLYDQAGRAAGILSNYLIERMRQLGHRAELARAVLKELVSSEAIRRQVSEVSLHQCYTHQAHDMREVLRILVDQRILRRLEDDEGSVYEVAHEYLIQEVRQWLDDSDFEVKRARDMLKREVESYRSYGMLIPHNRLAILAEHRTQLQIDNLDADLAKQPTQLQIDNLDAVACVTLSVYQESITQQLAPLITEDITQWVAPLAAMKSLAWALHSQHAEVRHAAVEILGKAAETLSESDYPQAVDTLMHALHHGIDVKIRCAAAEILGKFGDSRFPTTMDEWREELMQRTKVFGSSDSYWCYVQPGTYCIGGWEGSEESAAIELSGFWVARYPITVAQYQTFIEAKGYKRQDYWTPEGWQWVQELNRTQPKHWGEAHLNTPNQAVIGVTWYESMAFCTWLNSQLTDKLPKGYALHLPTEAEWEVAAAYDAQMQRRKYPWGEEEPTSEHAIFEDDQGKNLGAPAPVGVCPAGAAACGALDMGGNVWEWSQSSHVTYPWGAGERQVEFQRDKYGAPLRGGSWYLEGKRVSCAARYSEGPLYYGSDECGFRVLLSPTSPTTASRPIDNIGEMVDTGAE
jgi:formylglycine-generating enzyme required for sulfatase activity